ncbi:MAG: transglycosylase domain-containing protein [Geminicoccaceae bacterium]
MPVRVVAWTVWLGGGLISLALVGMVLAYLVGIDLGPPEGGTRERAPSVTLLDADGRTLATYGERYGAYVPLGELSPWLAQAVIAMEDRRFYHHPGLDPIGIVRALQRNWQAGRVVQGGSTITQQLAKISFLSHERSWQRKAQEALYTVWLELRFSKDEILEAYLNRIYLGAGAYGVDSAAQRYFGVSARDVTLPQAAMLAGLIKAPSRYAPTRDLALAQRRARVSLAAMVDAGMIDAAQAEAARADPATLASSEARQGHYFTDWVYADTRAYAGSETPDIAVRTTLDPKLQRLAERIVEHHLATTGRASRASEAALVAMTYDGRVRAMVGGRSYRYSSFNRATQAARQPGSAFKPIVNLAALEHGWQADDRISAERLRIGDWQPSNFDQRYPSSVSLRDALANSINTVAVRLAETVGRQAVIDTAKNLGIVSELNGHPSLSLGASGVPLIELTGAYATIAAEGRLAWPRGIETVSDAREGVLYRARAAGDAVADPVSTRELTRMLKGVVTGGTGQRAVIDRPVAGKTGTSTGNRDAWFIGYSAELVTGVWVGNDNGSAMSGVSGGGLPAMIWHDFMLAAHDGQPVRPLHDGGALVAQSDRRRAGDADDGAFDRLWQGLLSLFGAD